MEFTQYERLRRKSGLVLNADKTEILVLNSEIEKSYSIRYIDRVRLNYQT